MARSVLLRSQAFLRRIARPITIAVLLGLSPTRTAADDDYRVLAAPAAGSHSPLYRRLMTEAEAAIARRTAEYEAIRSPEQARAWQATKRTIMLECLGAFPEKTPLNAQTVGSLKGDGYILEKILFESRPNHHVTGNLYLPTSPPPYPAVIVPCGHSYTGKAADGYQRVSMLLARNGIAAFCYDPIGQGERYQTLRPDGTPLGENYVGGASSVRQLANIPGQPKFNPVEEHTLIGMAAILVGSNTANFRVWDGIRSIDYLSSRPDIDPKRIGCTGNSGGGTLTAYLMAVDERIVCAAPACAVTSFDRLLKTAGPQDAEQNLFAQLARGLDEADYLHLRAPRPTCLLAGTRDATFDIRGTWDVFREAKRFAARFGHPERVDLVEADAPHGFTIQLREGAVRWMRRWLLGKDDAITEPDLEVWPDRQLWCTPRGQVMTLPGERSVFDLIRDQAKLRASERRDFWKANTPQQITRQIRQLAGIRSLEHLPELQAKVVGKIPRSGYNLEKVLLYTSDDRTGQETPNEPATHSVGLPALLFTPAKATEAPYLYLHGLGKQAEAAPGKGIESLVVRGHPVLAVDIDGIGELQQRNPREWGGSLFGPNNQPFFLAYLLGRSFVGIQAEEILAVARHISAAHAKNTPIRIVAVGAAIPAALHAAAVEPALFSHLEIQGEVPSWESLMSTPTRGEELPTVVHNALKYYDQPDLIRLRPPGSTTIKPASPRQ
jgi:dienelactone hydrolase